MPEPTQKKPNDFLRPSVSVSGLLTAAGLVACAGTLFGFLGRFWWFFDLFSHFRVQYLAGLGLLGILLLPCRCRGTAAAFFAGALVNAVCVLPLFFGADTAPPPGSRALRAMLLNVNTHTGNPALVKQVIEELAPDILVLEEISDRWVAELEWLATSHPHRRVQPRRDNFGIGLYSKLPISDDRVVSIGGAEVPSIIAALDVDGTRLTVIATHPLPPGGAAYSHWRNEQLEQLPEHIPASQSVLLLGDLNVTPWNVHFRRLVKRSGLVDSSRGRGVQPTWPSGNPLLWIPIDHCLHSADLVVVDKRVGPKVGSDHYPVIVDVAIAAARR